MRSLRTKEIQITFAKLPGASAALLVTCSKALADGEANELTLISTTIFEGKVMSADQVFEGFGCTGSNMSPDLALKNAPEETENFVITVYDPDASTVSGWWH